MDYSHIAAVTNRKICSNKHLNMDFNEACYKDIISRFPLLSAISEENRLDSAVLIFRIEQLSRLALPIIILREKDLPKKDYLCLAKTAINILERSSSKLIPHYFYDVAKELNYRQIHLPMKVFTQLADRQAIDFFDTVGVSIHSLNEALLAEKLGASYITAGNIFDTDCKKGLSGRGLPFLKEITNALSIPVYAIGGITADNLSAVLDNGAALGCMMSNMM